MQGDHVEVRLPELFSTHIYLLNVRILVQWAAWSLLADARRPRRGYDYKKLFSTYLFLLNVSILAQWAPELFWPNKQTTSSLGYQNYFPPTYIYWMWESWCSEPLELLAVARRPHRGYDYKKLFSTYLFLLNVRILVQWVAWALLADTMRPYRG